jgi:hypothetical protein
MGGRKRFRSLRPMPKPYVKKNSKVKQPIGEKRLRNKALAAIQRAVTLFLE